MAAPKGNNHNPNGRPKGSINKVTAELRERWAEFVSHNFDQVQGWFDKAIKENPTEGLKLYIQFSNKVLPNVTQNTTDITSAGEKIAAPTIVINDTNANH